MSRVLGDAARIHESDWVQHGAAVLIEHNTVADCPAYDLQTDPLGFHGGRVGTKVGPLNCRVVHEIHLDEAHTPVAQGGVGLPQVFLDTRVSRIQHEKRVLFLSDMPNMNERTGGIVYKPFLVSLIDPCSL